MDSFDIMFMVYGASIIVVFVLALIVVAINVVFMVLTFKKVQMEWWKAIVPYYNTYIITQLAGLPILWFILSIVPYVNFVASIYIYYKLFRAFDMNNTMAIVCAIFPLVGLGITAFSKNVQYVGPQ